MCPWSRKIQAECFNKVQERGKLLHIYIAASAEGSR